MHITSALTDAAVLKALGDRIERCRIEAGLTQAALADRAGVWPRQRDQIRAMLRLEFPRSESAPRAAQQ